MSKEPDHSLNLSRQKNIIFKIIYRHPLSFLIAGIAFFFVGFFSHGFQGQISLFKLNSLFFVASMIYGVLFFLVGLSSFFRNYTLRIKAEALRDAEKVTLENLENKDFESFDRALRIREQKAKHDFEHNLGSKLVIQQMRARNMMLFKNAEWKFQPGVNILLGRNGYGKSLLLRSLAAVMQDEEEILNDLLRSKKKSMQPFIELDLTRNGKSEKIHRDYQRFTQSIGKIPLLAIPDSRFLDRSQDIVGSDDHEAWDLKTSGAHHFLYQRPYGSTIRDLLYELCLDYWDHNRSLDLPVFEFLRECVKRLTNYEFQIHSINRKGRTGFEINVLTEGNKEPIPIQYASQGTLSVLAMCGLIRSYVRSLSPDNKDSLAQKGSAIVLIDEADSHLHPAWQQKFPSLLRDFFPNVQFILSAHSPLFVAGCWRGEVAVLRRNELENKSKESGFIIDQLDVDFVGATAQELYRKVFEIEELDDTYLEYATKATLHSQNDRINDLFDRKEKRKISLDEEQELSRLEEEARRISRAKEVTENRKRQAEKDLQIEKLQTRIIELQRTLEGRGENI